jgi:succinoglycan biosynthesis protein ExoM
VQEHHSPTSDKRGASATDGSDLGEPEVSIIVPTFRRPKWLRAALSSCLAQQTASGRPFEIVVVDNAPDGSAAPIVAAIDAGNVELRYVHEPRPGISHARNAGFANARGCWLALMDDDERASADWLLNLTRAQRKHGADVVFGPVYPEFEQPPPERDGNFLTRFYTYSLKKPTGTRVGERATGNALVRRTCLRNNEPFRIELGLTGGEDHLFFRQLRSEGAVFVWCAEAIVTEVIPPERTTWRSIWRRSLQRGQCRAATPMLLDPPLKAHTVLWMGVGAMQFLGLLPVVCALWLFDRERALYCTWKMIGGLGKVLWMKRFRLQTYGEALPHSVPQR